MIDTIRAERDARDSMIRNGELPAMSPPDYAACHAMGLRLDSAWSSTTCLIVELPHGWAAASHPTDHRRWWILDDRGQRRLEAFWKAPALFSHDTGYGSVVILKPDGLSYRCMDAPWIDATDHKLGCLRCGLTFHYAFSRIDLDNFRGSASEIWDRFEQKPTLHTKRCGAARFVLLPWNQPMLERTEYTGPEMWARRSTPMWVPGNDSTITLRLTAYTVRVGENGDAYDAIVYAANEPDANQRAAVERAARIALCEHAWLPTGRHDLLMDPVWYKCRICYTGGASFAGGPIVSQSLHDSSA